MIQNISLNTNVLENTFLEIMETPDSWDPRTVREANGYYNIINKFDFVFFLNIFSLIMRHVEIFFAILQKKYLNIHDSVKARDIFLNAIECLRNEEKFQNLFNETINKVGDYVPPRKRKVPLKLSALVGEPPSECSDNHKLSFKLIYFELCDCVINLTKSRFGDIKHLESFKLIDYKMYNEYNRAFPHNLMNTLEKWYVDIFDGKILENELRVVYDDIQFHLTPIDLLRYFIENNLSNIFPQVLT